MRTGALLDQYLAVIPESKLEIAALAAIVDLDIWMNHKVAVQLEHVADNRFRVTDIRDEPDAASPDENTALRAGDEFLVLVDAETRADFTIYSTGRALAGYPASAIAEV